MCYSPIWLLVSSQHVSIKRLSGLGWWQQQREVGLSGKVQANFFVKVWKIEETTSYIYISFPIIYIFGLTPMNFVFLTSNRKKKEDIKNSGLKPVENQASHQRLSMWVWRTHTPLPFMLKLCISALDTAAVPTATGALQLKRETVSHLNLSETFQKCSLILYHNLPIAYYCNSTAVTLFHIW